MMRFEYELVKVVVNEVLERTGERLFLNLTVGQLLWGYNDTLLKDLKDVLAGFHIKLPISDQFGLFLGKNGSDDGVYEIYSGIGGHIDQFAEIVSWNGQTSLNYWKSTIANSLNGSDGTLFPPFVDTSKTKYLFSSDLCRSLQIQYTHGYGLKGIDVDRFVVPPLTFANVSANPYNQGFCTPHCLPAGLLNASVCKAGAPVILSLPHFLDGDPDVLDRVIGMKPNRSAHQSVIDIEPMTGVVMNAAKRLQLNAYLTNISHFKDLEQLHGWIALPILWLSESATIDDKSAADFRGEVLVAVKVTEAVQFGLIALGAVLLLGVAVVVIKKAFFSSYRTTRPTPRTIRPYTKDHPAHTKDHQAPHQDHPAHTKDHPAPHQDHPAPHQDLWTTRPTPRTTRPTPRTTRPTPRTTRPTPRTTRPHTKDHPAHTKDHPAHTRTTRPHTNDHPAHTKDHPAHTRTTRPHTKDHPAHTKDHPAHTKDHPAHTKDHPAPHQGPPGPTPRTTRPHHRPQQLWGTRYSHSGHEISAMKRTRGNKRVVPGKVV
ncbi:hypothetical protein ACOMHN_031465 [Nucella lapillus]